MVASFRPQKWLLVAFLTIGAAACAGEPEDSSPSDDGDDPIGGSNDGGGGRSSSGDGGTGAGGVGRNADGGGEAMNSGGVSAEGGGTGPGGAPPTHARSTCKRGVGYGYHSLADLQALSSGVSWWYNWAFRPDEDLREGAYLDEEVEYVPMIWGGAIDGDAAVAQIPDDARALLGFNEPNFGAQANLSAEAAAALWPRVEAIADARGLRLVSPAVNYCGGDCQDGDPFRYLDDFFAACDGCRVDVVAMHIYVGCSPSGDDKAEWLIGHVETYKDRFEQPLWLTEFACDDAQNMAEQQAFLEDAVTYLEGEPRIERYAWFATRADNMAHVDLLGADGELTQLGEAYVNAPQKTDCRR